MLIEQELFCARISGYRNVVFRNLECVNIRSHCDQFGGPETVARRQGVRGSQGYRSVHSGRRHSSCSEGSGKPLVQGIGTLSMLLVYSGMLVIHSSSPLSSNKKILKYEARFRMCSGSLFCRGGAFSMFRKRSSAASLISKPQ